MSRIVGSPVPRVDGRAKVTGAAGYAADARVRGAAHGFLVTSTVATGRVARIDTRRAERAPGVIAVLTHLTMPRLTRPASPGAAFLKRVLPLQDAEIHHSGQPVAYVVAETLEQAQHAATLVDVAYDAGRPRVVLAAGMDDAYVPPRGLRGENEISRGDSAAGLAEADVRIDAEYTSPMHHHNPIEPSTTTAVWEGDRVTLYESAQGANATRAAVAEATGVPVANVRVLSPYLGGGFGGKGPVWPHTVLTAAVAREVGRPVKLVLSRAHTYTSIGHRAEAHQRIRIGARRDGTLTAVEHVTTQQVSRTEEEIFSTSESTRMLYACPNVRVVQRAVRLDLPAPSFMRSPEAVVSHALESALDELSEALGTDPVELRMRNHTRDNPENGEPFGSKHLLECYRRGAAAFGWDRRDPRPGSMRDGGDLIGWGMATAAHTAGGRPGAGARVVVSTEGRAVIQVSTHDIGTGTYTVMTQLAAQVLGLPMEDVTFQLGDTDFPFAFISAASATVPGVGGAVNRTCTRARRALIEIAVADARSPLHGVPAGRISVEDGRLFVTDEPRRRTGVRTVLRRHGKPVEITTEPGSMAPGYSTGAVFAEVRVDPRLGQVRVTRMLGAFDAGRILNRRTIRSQAVGGFVWAVGFTLGEHTLVDPNLGRIVNPNLSGYLVPVNADIPEVQAIFVDEPDPTSEALGARGFGETPMTGMTAAIANAVHHATGARIRDLPITQDKIIRALER
ncbi:xanthine dehydrogenase family protein molybdopterin-binding subunit [Streptomyces sp. TRM 70361]|uniref:xanthine dehydrogenase family protein molybdopterin-binding subunit n=1 Tax=Streptomyces sp. TRM 70361 TaxID=3116553 RepID=UPI002E7AC178|nr:xanthine dehydrogenase family protein molybdopterin-binding subunit [Streptomyces sp. TRM 70361]MEE1939903.1 xanthine dehydrogenase family protein molybdopterin-binding subunit [Streptomyces sp. TRM 70361]